MQNAGQILCVHFPWTMCFHGGEHVLLLFSRDLSRLGAIKVSFSILHCFFICNMLTSCQPLVLKACRLYNIFGSGDIHAIHDQFMAQVSIFNYGHKIGLLQGAGICFATWFNAIHWLLRLKRALKVTIHGAAFESVAKNARNVLAVEDIEDEIFWNSIFCLLRAVFPSMKALRYCDSKVPAMDNFFLVKRADVAIENSLSMLNDEELFSSVDN